ncbi:MAG: NADPH-dependent glutamate synthase [Limnochordia bacterium]|nr:NADPH-dependent glutamate synthase [Limnochordia bacterium]MDD2628827.1 NADPH-dependent glutamate synthase [Limnochordia bacterium]
MGKIQPRTKMPVQSAQERIENFHEVNQGLSVEEAVAEAKRCIQCKHRPCVAGCPVGIEIPDFIKLIAAERFAEALDKIKEKNSLPAICGRVCPQERQCESVCTLGKRFEPVAIGALERFAADWGRNHSDTTQATPNTTGQALGKVATVGSGPSAITCAAELARLGYQVTMFEALHEPGGVLVYGIPEFRLPKQIVKEEIEYVQSLGVDIKTNVIIGRTLTLEELFSDLGFDAVFLGAGAGTPYFLGIPGENANGVFSSNEFLTRVNLMKAYKFPEVDTPVKVGKKVVVIGGGNTAMDAARTARRLGAEVTVVYRRSREEMPARGEEIVHAVEEGIVLELLTVPHEILFDERRWVTGLVCGRMELGPQGPDGRRKPVLIPDSSFELPADTVIVAIGQGPNPLLAQSTPGLAVDAQGNVITEDGVSTSLSGVFAGGDLTGGESTVISAMGDGKKAAMAIHRYLQAGK